jgi:hypothetical protein
MTQWDKCDEYICYLNGLFFNSTANCKKKIQKSNK